MAFLSSNTVYRGIDPALGSDTGANPTVLHEEKILSQLPACLPDKTQNILVTSKASELKFQRRNWKKDTLKKSSYNRFKFGKDVQKQIKDRLSFVKANNLTLDTVTQEDFRLPSLAKDMASLRHTLDDGVGFLILDTGLSSSLTEEEFEIVGWSVCNYFGQIMRQGIDHDLRLFTVADKGTANTDPTRIGASAKRSAKHSDNGCLEPRPPCYLGLFCYQASNSGGDSTIISAQTILRTIIDERPDLLPYYFQNYHFRVPQSHIWPSKGPTVEKPLMEFRNGELQIHYARVMISPGMEMAGLSLTCEQIEALDFLDDVIERSELNFKTLLKQGELLVINNLAFLHGRDAFTPGMESGRILKRFWMWRRHIGPGTDPMLLDLAELADQEQ